MSGSHPWHGRLRASFFQPRIQPSGKRRALVCAADMPGQIVLFTRVVPEAVKFFPTILVESDEFEIPNSGDAAG